MSPAYIHQLLGGGSGRGLRQPAPDSVLETTAQPRLQSPHPCEQRGRGGSLLLLELPLRGEAASGKDGVFR